MEKFGHLLYLAEGFPYEVARALETELKETCAQYLEHCHELEQLAEQIRSNRSAKRDHQNNGLRQR